MDNSVKRVLLSSDFAENRADNSSIGTDVVVVLVNGLKYAASFLSYSEIEKLRQRNIQNGEFLHGSYYWGQNLVLVENCEQETVERVVDHLIDEGDFLEAFRRL